MLPKDPKQVTVYGHKLPYDIWVPYDSRALRLPMVNNNGDVAVFDPVLPEYKFPILHRSYLVAPTGSLPAADAPKTRVAIYEPTGNWTKKEDDKLPRVYIQYVYMRLEF